MVFYPYLTRSMMDPVLLHGSSFVEGVSRVVMDTIYTCSYVFFLVSVVQFLFSLYIWEVVDVYFGGMCLIVFQSN